MFFNSMTGVVGGCLSIGMSPKTEEISREAVSY